MSDQSSPHPLTSSPPHAALGLAALCAAFAVAGGVLLAFGGPLVALAALLAGAAAFAVLREMELGLWGVIGVVTLLPFATLPIDIGITPTFLDLALGAVVGIWAMRQLTGQQRRVVTAPVTLPLVVFMVLALFAFIFGLSNGPLTSSLMRRFAELLLSLGFVLVIVDYCRTWERLERLVMALLLAGGGAAAVGVLFWLLPEALTNEILNALTRVGYPGGFVIRYIEENPALAERAIGTSVDPNVFGGMLVLIGGLVGPQVVARRPLLPRPLTWLVGGLVFLALILTFSRGALLALLAALAFVALARYRRLIPYMVVAGLLFLLLPIAQTYLVRLVEGFQGQDLATQMRFGEYRDALILISRYPVFGVGFAGSPDIDLYLGVAMVYLSIAEQMGITGLLAFIAVIGTVFGNAWTNRHHFRADPQRDPVWLGLHAALVGGLVAGVFDHYLFNLDFHHAVTLFWLFVGLATAATRVGSQGR